MGGTVLVTLLALGMGAGCTRAAGHETRDGDARGARALERGRWAGGRLVAGTLVEVRLEDSLALGKSRPGDAVRATVTGDVGEPRGAVVIPEGSTVRLRITELEPGRITLWVTALTVRGRTYVVHSRVDSPPYTVRRRGASRGVGGRHDIVVTSGTRIVFPLDRTLTVATR